MGVMAFIKHWFVKWRAIQKTVKIGLHRAVINLLLLVGRRCKARTISYEKAAALHERYPKRDIYKYDTTSKMNRATGRFNHLCSIIDMNTVKSVAELGVGDGQLALLFFQKGFSMLIIDTADWRDDEVRQSDVRFQQVKEDTQYEIPDKSIDLFMSYGTFEHVRDPAWVLKESIRVTRTGGYVYLLAGPLYNSPWGLHAYRTFYAPYPQFLVNKNVMGKFVEANGIYDLGVRRKDFQYVNGWSASDYQNLIESVKDRVEIRMFKRKHIYDEIGVVYKNLRSFWGRNLTFDELTTEAIEVCLRVQ